MFTHLLALSNEIGTFEHAEYRTPRPEHGYCTDDVARVLIAVCAERERSGELRDLESRSLRFVIDAQNASGQTCNRRAVDGRWFGTPSTDDCWGRSVWALGVAAADGSTASSRRSARTLFELCSAREATSPRALAFATFGAERMHEMYNSREALTCVHRLVQWFDEAPTDELWPWPEPRLAYANAAICEALIVAGALIDRMDIIHRGLGLLEWLVGRETCNGHLSPTPVGGAGPNDSSGRFDQQPIEIASMAAAAHRAFEVTDDVWWLDVVESCGRWFDGDNDIGQSMWDPATGAGFDGLHSDGVNQNCGAESTLAAITTMQHRADITSDAVSTATPGSRTTS